MKKRVEFKNHQREIFHFQLRLVVGIGFVSVLLAILLVRPRGIMGIGSVMD